MAAPGYGRTVSEAILFDRDQVEKLDDLGDRPKRLNRGKLLWVDVDRGSAEEADEVAEAFGLDSATSECLANSKDRAVFKDHGRYIHVTTYAPDEDDEGELHRARVRRRRELGDHRPRRPIPVLEEFATRVSGSGDTGSLDGPELPGRPARVGARLLLGRVRADRGAAGGVRRPGDARRHGAGGHRAADRHAPAGREAAPRARRAPLGARRADPSRSWRRSATTPPASGSSRSSAASRRRCRRRATRARRSSAPSTC